jgi:hypothetical protein
MLRYRSAVTAVAVYATLFSQSAFALVRDLNIVNRVIAPDGVKREYVVCLWMKLSRS